MDKIKLQQMAELASDNIKKKKTILFDATESRLSIELPLEQSISRAYSEGKIEGGNDRTRKANERVVFSEEFDKLSKAEFAERKAKYEYDQAAIDVDTVKTLLRIAELPE